MDVYALHCNEVNEHLIGLYSSMRNARIAIDNFIKTYQAWITDDEEGEGYKHYYVVDGKICTLWITAEVLDSEYMKEDE